MKNQDKTDFIEPEENKQKLQENDESLNFPGLCSIIIGFLDICIIIYVVVIPIGDRFDPDLYFQGFLDNTLGYSAAWIILAATSILAIAIIPAITDYVYKDRSKADSNARYFQKSYSIKYLQHLAIVGYGISAASVLTLIGKTPELAQVYVSASDIGKEAINAIGFPSLDPYNILILGAPGIWFLCVNIKAIKNGILSKMHSISGIILGIFFWVAVVAVIINNPILDSIAAGVGAIFGPIWHIWIGIRLLKKKE